MTFGSALPPLWDFFSLELTLFRLDETQSDIERCRPDFTNALLNLLVTRNIGAVSSGSLPNFIFALTYVNRRSTFDPRMCNLNNRSVLLEVDDERPQFRFYRSRPDGE